MAEAIFKEMIDTCSCCEGLTPETPVRIANRPGLSAIAYRTGAYASFRKSLLARLSASGIPALQKLTTRNEDDFTIALLDAWSMMADVLTFYQERIANESYIDTLTERDLPVWWDMSFDREWQPPPPWLSRWKMRPDSR